MKKPFSPKQSERKQSTDKKNEMKEFEHQTGPSVIQGSNRDAADSSKGGASEYEPVDDALSDGELDDDELEEVAGGLATVMIPKCKHCRRGVAVYEQSLCAACFLKVNSNFDWKDISE